MAREVVTSAEVLETVRVFCGVVSSSSAKMTKTGQNT